MNIWIEKKRTVILILHRRKVFIKHFRLHPLVVVRKRESLHLRQKKIQKVILQENYENTIVKGSSLNTERMNQSITDPLSGISRNISLYGNILILIIGNISNIIKIFFFFQYPLRSHACSYYIVAGTVADLFFLNNQPFIRVLRQLNLVGLMFSFECSIRSYFQTLSFSLSFTFLILAAFDRYCFTSRKYTHRKLSHPRTGLRLIFIVTLTWIIFNTHQLFHHKLRNGICTARFAHRYLGRFMFIFFVLYL